MSKPTRELAREIDDLEQHITTINELLDVLRIGLANANTERLSARLDREIARQLDRLAELHARRDALARRLGGKGRKRST